MDQFKSSEQAKALPKLPRRPLTLEFFVGIFTMIGLGAAAYLAIGLGELQLFGSDKYEINAEFDNISGLKTGASVEIAGVQVGEVKRLNLKDPMAVVTMQIDKGIRIRDDDIVSIRTKGIIGDRYVKISRGASDRFIPEGGMITETESVVDIEDIIGKIVHNLSGDKSEGKNGE